MATSVDLFSYDILDTGNTDEGQTTLFNFVDSASFLFVFVFWATLILFKVSVSETDGSKCLNSVGFDDIVQVAFDLVIKDLSFTIGINIVGASFEHDFGSTFGVKSSVEAVFGLVVFIELDDGGHSLSGGVEWESDHWVAGIVLSHVVEIGIASLDELEHGDFGGRPVRDGTLSVARNTLLDEVQVVLVGAEAVGVNGS